MPVLPSLITNVCYISNESFQSQIRFVCQVAVKPEHRKYKSGMESVTLDSRCIYLVFDAYYGCFKHLVIDCDIKFNCMNVFERRDIR